MAYKGVMDDVRKAVAMERPKTLPAFIMSEEADVRICGSRYDRYCSDAKEMIRVQCQAIERFDYDWAWLQVDDCIEFEPLGVGVKGEGDILRATCDYLPTTQEGLKQLNSHGYKVEGRMKVLLDAISGIKAKLGDTICLTGRLAAPFSAATLAFGISEMMLLLYDKPDFVREAIKFFEEYQIRFGLDQIKAGADAIWFGDCNASGHLISPDLYKQFAMDSARRVSDAYKEAGCVVMYHASEELPAMVDIQADMGFSILSVGPGIDIVQTRKIVGQRVCLSGNVNPIEVLARGTPQMVRDQVRRTIENVSVHGGHVMNSGEMVPRETPEQNIEAFMEAARTVWKQVPADSK